MQVFTAYSLMKLPGSEQLYFRVTIQSLISQNLRFYSMWRIRQITLCKDMFMNASIHHISLIKLLGSEQLQKVMQKGDEE